VPAIEMTRNKRIKQIIRPERPSEYLDIGKLSPYPLDSFPVYALGKGKIFHYADFPWFQNGDFVVGQKQDGVSCQIYLEARDDPKLNLMVIKTSLGESRSMSLNMKLPYSMKMSGEIIASKPMQPFSGYVCVTDVHQVGCLEGLPFATRFSALQKLLKMCSLPITAQNWYSHKDLKALMDYGKRNGWEGLVLQPLFAQAGQFPSGELRGRSFAPTRYLKFDPDVDIEQDVNGTKSIVTVSLRTKEPKYQIHSGSIRRLDKDVPNAPDYIKHISTAPAFEDVVEALTAPIGEPIGYLTLPDAEEWLVSRKETSAFKASLAVTFPSAISFDQPLEEHTIALLYQNRFKYWVELRNQLGGEATNA